MLFNQATTWRVPPSDLLSIDDEYVAFCLNQAVFHIGITIKAELEGVEGKNSKEIEQKRSRIIDKYFSDEDTVAKGYADPAMFFK